MNLDEALTSHSEWKEIFAAAISARQKMDSHLISEAGACELGIWLDEISKQKCAALPSYSRLVQNHNEFHQEAGKIAELINRSEFHYALSKLNNDSPYTSASHSIFAAITVFKNETKS